MAISPRDLPTSHGGHGGNAKAYIFPALTGDLKHLALGGWAKNVALCNGAR